MFEKILICSLVFALAGCGDTTSGTAPRGDVTGTWSITLRPSGEDAGADSSAQLATIPAVILAQGGNRISGEYDIYRIEGRISGNDIDLNFHQTGEDGKAEQISTLNLRLDASGQMVGSGINYSQMKGEGVNVDEKPHEGSTPDKNDLFVAEAHRVESGETNLKGNSVADIACNIVGGLTSFIVGYASDNTFRPMGGCWLQKDGGGYYIFGRTGPGSLTPYWTQTVYYPIEKAVCKERRYHFTISIGNPIMPLDMTELLLKQMSKGIALQLGLPMDVISDNLVDFFNRYGAFAISYALNTNTGNASLYINVASGWSTGQANHPLISFFTVALQGVAWGNVDVFVGGSINDYFYLRRNVVPAGPYCNTPLVMGYLIGTNEVTYD